MNAIWTTVAAGLLAAAAPLLARAQEPASEELAGLSLEELMNVTISGASKFDQRLGEAPASVTVVTRDQIAKLGYRNLADLLRGQREFQVSYDRNYSYVGVRGFGRTGDYNTRILILVDGHRVNDNIYDGANVGNESLLDLDLVERVEVIRGAGSSLYGNNAFFGVVNFILRKGGSLGSAEASVEAASFGTHQARATGGYRFGNGLELLLSASGLDSKGADRFYPEFADPSQGLDGVARRLDSERRASSIGTLSYRDLTVQAAFASREKHIPTASWGAAFNDPRYRSVDERGYLDARYAPTLGRLLVEARLFLDYYAYRGDIPWQDVAVVLNKDSARNWWWGGQLQLTGTVLGRHRLVGGAEFASNLIQRFENHDVDPYFQYLDVSRRTSRQALFLQDEVSIADGLVLNAGLRYDHYDTFGGAFSPRAALIYGPFASTSVKLVYGTAFRAPNNYELFYESVSYAMVANPALHPEQVQNLELAIEQTLGKSLRWTASAFRGSISDLIRSVAEQSDPADPATAYTIFRNTGGVRTNGVATELQGQWSSGLRGSFSYSFQEARDSESGAILVNSPRHMAKGRVTVPLARERLFASPEVLVLGSRRTLAGRTLAGAAVVNLTLLSRGLLRGLELSGSIYNLLGARYGDPGGDEHAQDVIPQDGRSFRLKLTHRF